MEVGGMVMDGDSDALLQSDDIREFYLGKKEESVRGRQALEETEDLAMTMPEVTSHDCDTLPKLFLKMSAIRGDRIAMREKDFGIWQSYSWNDYREYALAIANGLVVAGAAKRRCCFNPE